MKHSAIYQKKRASSPRWFNKWVQSPAWFVGFWIAVAVCLILYAVNAMVGRIHPATTWGLSYGIAAAVLFVVVFFYSIKRRTMKIRALGRAWPYLQAHVYGGALFILLMFMHIGFGIPQGALTWWLWFLSLWVVGSGLLGIAVQKWIPTVLAHGLSVEAHYDRIPELVDDLRERADGLVADATYDTRDLYRKHVAAALTAPQTRPAYFLNVTGGLDRRMEPFEDLHPLLPDDDQATLAELRQIYRTKLELDAHFTLQKALRGWLFLHVPVALVLIALLALHIYTVLYY